MDKAAFFIFNVFLNSFLSFCTVVLLIEAVIFLCRIRAGRISALLRMIPILKLPFDLYLYDFSRWSYTQGINPLHCPAGTRNLSVILGKIGSTVEFTTANHATFTLADLIGYSIDPVYLKIFAIILISLSLGFILKQLMRVHRSLQIQDQWTQTSQPIFKKTDQAHLLSSLKKFRTQIVASSQLTGSPFVTGLFSSTIYFPYSLLQHLSQQEYEAILAHEIEHVRHKDNFIHLLLDLIGTIFWWIPIKGLRARIANDLEIGSDRQCARYGIDPTDLASAIHLCAKHSIHTPHPIMAHHFTQQSSLKRLQILLDSPFHRFKKTDLVRFCLAIGLSVVAVFLGRFWIF